MLFQVSVNPTSYSLPPIFNNEENTVEVSNNIENPNVEKINTKFENLVKETILDDPDLSQFNLFEDISASNSASEELLTQNGNNWDLVSLEFFFMKVQLDYLMIDKFFDNRQIGIFVSDNQGIEKRFRKILVTFCHQDLTFFNSFQANQNFLLQISNKMVS